MANRQNIEITKLAHLRGHSDSIYDFAVDKTNERIYSAGADGYLVKWMLNGSSDGELVLKGDEAFYCVFLDESEQKLYAGTRSGYLYAVDLNTKKLLFKRKAHEGGVFFIRRIDGILLSGGEDGKLMVDDTPLKLSGASLRCCASKGGLFCIGSSDGLIYLLDADTLRLKGRLEGHDKAVFGLEFLNDNVLVSTGRDARIRTWDVLTFKQIHEVPAHEYQGKSLTYNGRLLLSSSMDKSIKVWTHELELLKVMDYARNQSHVNCINKVLWVNEEVFVSSSDDRMIMVWQIQLNS